MSRPEETQTSLHSMGFFQGRGHQSILLNPDLRSIFNPVLPSKNIPMKDSTSLKLDDMVESPRNLTRSMDMDQPFDTDLFDTRSMMHPAEDLDSKLVNNDLESFFKEGELLNNFVHYLMINQYQLKRSRVKMK